MGTRKIKNLNQIKIEETDLIGERLELFKRFRKIYPQGNPKLQLIVCETLDEVRVSYYLDYLLTDL